MTRHALRPCLTAGIAIVGVSLVALTLPQHPEPTVAHQQDVTLTAVSPLTPYADLLTNTAGNLGALIGNTLRFPILHQVLSDPAGSLQHLPDVVSLLLNISPEIHIDSTALPLIVTGDMPPLLDLAVGALSPLVTTGNAAFGIGADVFNVFGDPAGAISAVLAAPALLADAFLNARDGIGVVGLTVPTFNGILVPGQSLDTTADLGQLADNTGLNSQTLTELADHFGLGDQQVAGIATSLLDALGLGQATPVDLVNEIGLGGKQVTDVAAAVLNALGIGQLTPAGLVEQLGGGDQTVAGVATSVLSALGLGDQNAIELLDAAGIGNVTVGSVLAGLLGGVGQSDLTVGGFLTEAGLADVTVGDIADATQLTNTSVGSILSGLGFNINLNDLISATGGSTAGINASLISLMSTLNDLTLGDILGLQPTTTLLDLLTQAGVADVPLSTLAEQNQTTISDLLTNAGLGGADLNTVVSDLLGTTTVTQLLSDLGLDEQDLSTLVSNLPTDTTVSTLLAGTAWGNSDLNTIVTEALGSTTVNGLLTDLGLNNTTIGDLLTDLGVADAPILHADIGEFFGIVPGLLNGLPEQIAHALAGGS